MNHLSRLIRLSGFFVLGCGSSTAGFETQPPDDSGAAGEVVFSIDATRTYPISRYIYGGNFLASPANYGGATPPAELTFNRMGGNRLTAYNWENNYSNAGNDYEYHNDEYLSASTKPGEAVRVQAAAAFAKGQAFMATIPMIGYVAANKCNCNVGTTDADRATRLATHFHLSQPTKGSALSAVPNTGDGMVFQDEFVHWFETTFPGRSTHATAPVFYSLDNEVDIWHSTHKEINSDLNDDKDTPRLQTYRGLSETSIDYARAIKAVSPGAQVFGPALATYTGIVTLGRYPTPDPDYGNSNFLDYYLDRMQAAEATYGKRLLDVLDIHYYPAIGTRGGEISNDFAPQDSAAIWARVQGPRSLWDPTFNEQSWVSGVTGGPIRLIPRLKEQIAAHYPGTKLAITEYYFGRGGDISGGIAQADVLGIFGREGVFAASLWPNAGLYAQPWAGDGNKAYAFIFGAFRMFRNYDGAGGAFGEIGVQATTNAVAASSVYASRNAAGDIVVVAINKTTTARPARLTGIATAKGAKVWALTAAAPQPVKQADLTAAAAGVISYTMPAMSVSTIVITR